MPYVVLQNAPGAIRGKGVVRSEGGYVSRNRNHGLIRARDGMALCVERCLRDSQESYGGVTAPLADVLPKWVPARRPHSVY